MHTMPGYYPHMAREPVPMMQAYPPARSYSLAKLNQTRDNGLYEKVRVDNSKNYERRPNKMFDKLRRQQSCDADAIRSMFHNQPQPRRQEGFDSLQLLGANRDERYLDRFMDPSRGRPTTRENEQSKSKSTLLSNKSNNSKNSSNSSNNIKMNKEIKRAGMNFTSEILAYIGSLKNSSSVDNIYESVEQIQYRKSLDAQRRRDKVRSIHRTGHPLFDHLREERAIAIKPAADEEKNKRVSRSAGPSRKTSVQNSPIYTPPSSGDEQYVALRRNRGGGLVTSRSAMTLQHPSHQERYGATSRRRPGSAGSESDDEWVIPRPKIGGRRREVRTISTDESDSSSKSSPMR